MLAKVPCEAEFHPWYIHFFYKCLWVEYNKQRDFWWSLFFLNKRSNLCERISPTLRSCDADLSAGSHMIPPPKHFSDIATLFAASCMNWCFFKPSTCLEGKRRNSWKGTGFTYMSASFIEQKPTWINVLPVSPPVKIQISFGSTDGLNFFSWFISVGSISCMWLLSLVINLSFAKVLSLC